MATNAGLLDKLGKPGKFTLFAPTNDAFSKLDREVMDRLMGNKGALQGKLVIQSWSALTFKYLGVQRQHVESVCRWQPLHYAVLLPTMVLLLYKEQVQGK